MQVTLCNQRMNHLIGNWAGRLSARSAVLQKHRHRIARSGLLRERARAAPAGELRDHSGRAIGAWLRDERGAAEALAAEGLDVSAVRAGLDPALESGLADLP